MEAQVDHVVEHSALMGGVLGSNPSWASWTISKNIQTHVKYSQRYSKISPGGGSISPGWKSISPEESQLNVTFLQAVRLSLLLASFHYYWLFWPTQSWHCHHSDISLTLYYGLCRAQSRTKLFPALSRTKLFPALSRTKSMYHGPILEISALSISHWEIWLKLFPHFQIYY